MAPLPLQQRVCAMQHSAGDYRRFEEIAAGREAAAA
jgi:hypothetical protein